MSNNQYSLQSNPPPSSPVELDQRLRDLEEREKYVRQQEALLESWKHEASIYEKSTQIKKDQFDRILLDIAAASKEAEAKMLAVKRVVQVQEDKLTELHLEIDVVSDLVRDGEREVRTAKKTLASIHQEQVDARKYLKEQQALIDKTIEEGNTTLKAINYEVKGLEAEKKEIEHQVYEVNQEKSKATDELESIVQFNDELLLQREDQVSQYDKTLEELKKRTAQAKKELEGVTKATEAKLAILKTKEEGIVAKQSAIRKEREELTLERRRFDTRQSLYDD